ncbi:MAG: MGT family glycosyltransferase [Acidobacteria bacterium]|nr:MAG: MGT family glycosyltransferase [Acidobacteriota bacterium]
MSHFGILSLPATGHLHPLTALGRELVRRHHTVTVFQVSDVEHLIRAAGLRFRQIGELDFTSGTLRGLNERLSRLHGAEATAFVFEWIRDNTKMVLRDAPAAIRREGIDALIVDQAEFAGGSVAEYLGLPFVTAILALPLNLHSSSLFGGLQWEVADGVRAKGQDTASTFRLGLAQANILALINRQRQEWGLRRKTGLDACDSKLAQITQLPSGFDFPNEKTGSHFHYTGPFVDGAGRREISFPWPRLDPARPLVFVSMGTLQNGIEWVFREVAKACAEVPVQTVISLGGGLSREVFKDLPGDPIVVNYAPQLELLRRAALTIFHGGLNTALECLVHGVPMIAVPITFDQPGVAARLVRAGAGRMIPMGDLTAETLRAEILEVLTNAKYGTAAKHLQKQSLGTTGVQQAADIIDRILELRLTRARPRFCDAIAGV